MTGRTYGWFEVESLSGSRFKLALEFFQGGRPFIFDGVAFALGERQVQCSVPSSWMLPTEQSAGTDFARAEQVLEHLIQASPEFAALVGGLSRTLLLVSDDGMSTVVHAERRDGLLRWLSPTAG